MKALKLSTARFLDADEQDITWVGHIARMSKTFLECAIHPCSDVVVSARMETCLQKMYAFVSAFESD